MSRLTSTSLQYTDDLITHYQTLSDLPGFVLLESSDKQRGRYDIVTALPYDTLKIWRHSPNLQQALIELQDKLPTATAEGDLPFQGGAIGYIAYDFGEMLAGIHSAAHPRNDTPVIDVGFYDWAIVTDHQTKSVRLVAANIQADTKAIVNEILIRWKQSPTILQPFILQRPFTPLVSETQYQKAFAEIHRDLSAGRAYQVNYTQPFLGQYSGDTWGMYKQVRARNPVPYSAFLRGVEGDLLSFSPERFLSMEKGWVYTSPIKGTINRSTNLDLDNQLRVALKESAKNQAENIMIVDLLRNDLGKLARPGSVKVTALCEVESYNEVHHLVSHIQAQIPDQITALQVFSAAFPGGSITGAPKREAMHIIAEHERYSRGVYCGNIFYLSAHGRFDSNIAIRTVTAQQDSLYLSAGGGIVIDSNWEDEYRECFSKIAAIVNELQTT